MQEKWEEWKRENIEYLKMSKFKRYVRHIIIGGMEKKNIGMNKDFVNQQA